MNDETTPPIDSATPATPPSNSESDTQAAEATPATPAVDRETPPAAAATTDAAPSDPATTTADTPEDSVDPTKSPRQLARERDQAVKAKMREGRDQ